MRKIEQAIENAISANVTGNFGNTLIFRHTDGASLKVYLHHNHIATLHYSGQLNCYTAVEFTLAGWPSRITRSRLSLIMGAAFGRGKMALYQEKNKQKFRFVSGAFDNHMEIDEKSWYRCTGNICYKLIIK